MEGDKEDEEDGRYEGRRIVNVAWTPQVAIFF
jgi:hypothetical protein